MAHIMSFRIILISRASALDLTRSLKVPKMSLSSNEAWQINHGNMSDGYDQVSRFHVLVNSTKYKSVV